MALEGNANSFGLSEILQLIAVQQKTGMLTISASDKQTTVFFFKNGQVISTRDRRRRNGDPFLDYLTRYGILDNTGLVRLNQICSQSKLDMLEVLVSEGFLTDEALQKHWQRQIQEAMHDVLTWSQCSYKFMASDSVVSGIRVAGEFNIEAMLMECMRRIDEHPQLRELYPHSSIIISRGEHAIDNEETTSNERAVFDVASKPTTIKELIARAGLPEFEVYEAIKGLCKKSMLSARDEQALQHVDQVSPVAGKRRARRRRRNPLPLVAALLLLAGAGFVGFTANRAAFAPKFVSAQSRSQVEYRLRWAVEAYRATQGHYPKSLQTLQGAGLASARLLDAAEALEFKYRLTPSGTAYTL